MSNPVLLDLISRCMTDGVVALDSKGIIVHFNPAAFEILGLEGRNVIGLPYAEVFIASEKNDEFNQHLLDLVTERQGKRYEETSYFTIDGRALTLLLTTNLLVSPDDGSNQGVLLVFKDITKVSDLRRQRDALAAENAAKHMELTEAYLKLEQRNKALNERRRRLFRFKLLVATLALVMFAALGWFNYSDLVATFRELSSPAQATENQTSYRSAIAQTGPISDSVSTSGDLSPLKYKIVSAYVGGRVVDKHVELGQKVTKGELLYQLSKAEVMPTLRNAQAAKLRAKEKLDELVMWAQRPETKQAQRALRLAAMELDRKKKRLVDAKSLFNQGVIPGNELQTARDEVVRAQASLADAQERLALARARGSREKIMVARLEYENAAANYKEALQDVADTEVRAPAGGVVMRPEIGQNGKQSDLPRPGSSVQEGQALLTLGLDDQLGLDVEISEADITKIKPGLPVVASFRNSPGTNLPGSVRKVAVTARKGANGVIFPVTVALDKIPPHPARQFRLGMISQVKIIVDQEKNAVLIPIMAVEQGPQGPVVRVKTDEGYATRPVRLGIRGVEFVQVVEGVEPGESVYY